MQGLVLATSSKYRQQLLKKLHLDFIARSSEIDESPLPNESAEALALRLSAAKAHAVAAYFPDHLIIGSDQVATLGTQLLGKPGNPENAFQQLKAQSGKKLHFTPAFAYSIALTAEPLAILISVTSILGN